MDNWKKEYIAILRNGPEPSQYNLASELIGDGYGTGKVIRNLDGPGNEVKNLLWSGPTVAGREYLDDLEARVDRESWRYRVKLFLLWVSGVFAALLTQWIGQLAGF